MLFTDDSPFVTEDNRRFRPHYATTAELLNNKHGALLPREVVQDASVLDIGSCLGATGWWVSRQGARSYLGVEHQAGYVDHARRLLADEAGCRFEQSTAEAYLARPPERFDVVCLLGMVHGVFDPLAVIRDAAARADKYLCFDDMGWHSDAPVMIIDLATKMPLAGEKAASVGFGWLISPSAMELIMRFLGFEPDMTAVFNGSRRWLCRYRRSGPPGEEASYASRTESWVPGAGAA